jgi:hypothetical protein
MRAGSAFCTNSSFEGCVKLALREPQDWHHRFRSETGSMPILDYSNQMHCITCTCTYACRQRTCLAECTRLTPGMARAVRQLAVLQLLVTLFLRSPCIPGAPVHTSLTVLTPPRPPPPTPSWKGRASAQSREALLVSGLHVLLACMASSTPKCHPPLWSHTHRSSPSSVRRRLWLLCDSADRPDSPSPSTPQLKCCKMTSRNPSSSGWYR